MDFIGPDHVWEGPVHGGFTTRQDMVDISGPAPVTALNETWTLTAYVMPGAARPVHVFGLEIVQSCATSAPLILPEYHYRWPRVPRSIVVARRPECTHPHLRRPRRPG